MEVATLREWETLIAMPMGKIDGSNADDFLKALEDAIESTDQALILDMENVTYIGSAGLRIVGIMNQPHQGCRYEIRPLLAVQVGERRHHRERIQPARACRRDPGRRPHGRDLVRNAG